MLPYPDQDAVPFTTLTAQFYDETIANIESLSAGTGFENGAIPYAAMSSKIAFGAYQSSSQTIPVTTFTKVSLQTEEFDSGSVFDNTLFRFVAPATDQYPIMAAVAVSGTGDTNRIFATLYKNGVEYKRGARVHASTTDTVASTVAVVANLTQNDYVELYIWQNSGGSKSTINDASQTYMSGFRAR